MGTITVHVFCRNSGIQLYARRIILQGKNPRNKRRVYFLQIKSEFEGADSWDMKVNSKNGELIVKEGDKVIGKSGGYVEFWDGRIETVVSNYERHKALLEKFWGYEFNEFPEAKKYVENFS